MTRGLRSKDLLSLRQVTEARELAAMARVSALASQLDRLTDEMEKLRNKTFEILTPEGAQAMERWSLWRGEELRRLAVRQAQVAAEHRVAAELAGRLIAENAVMDRLVKRAADSEGMTRSRRQTYIS
ncbi:MAG: hypothetical protein QNJ20_03350 [Paracoccaceae bacterium]|nr:hypothetical protein [Paracoccaceae bacterium]